MDKFPQLRRSAVLIAAASLAISLAGCSSDNSNTAAIGESSTTGEAPPVIETPSRPPTIPEKSGPTKSGPTKSGPTKPGSGKAASTKPESATAHLRPCDLLSERELTALDVPPDGEERKLGSFRVCAWQKPGSHSLTVGVADALGGGMDNVVAEPGGVKEPTTVGSHDAIRYDGVLGICALAIGVSETSRVEVMGAAHGNKTVACEVAHEAAALVEPKLP